MRKKGSLFDYREGDEEREEDEGCEETINQGRSGALWCARNQDQFNHLRLVK